MVGEAPKTGPQPGNILAGGAIVTLADFEAADWEAPIRDAAIVDHAELADRFHRAQAKADADSPSAQAFGLLGNVCGIRLVPEQPGAPFEPIMMAGPRHRSATASDYAGPQSAVFEQLAARTENPGLRARLADIAWFNRRGAKACAALAVEAYREMVDGLADGRYDPSRGQDPEVSYDQVTYLHRALQLHRATAKDKAIPPPLATTAAERYRAARDRRHLAIFARLSRLARTSGLLDPTDAAKDAEAFAGDDAASLDALARKDAYILAADAWRAAKDGDRERQCRLKAVDLGLKASTANTLAIMRAHALREAIAELRAIPSTRERRQSLEAELRAVQAESAHDFTPINHSVDIGDIVSGTLEVFEGLSLADALLRFGFLSSLIDYGEEKADYRASAQRFPLQAMFSESRLDRDGKVVAEGKALGLGTEPDEDWYLGKLNAHMPMRRSMITASQIEPVRQALVAQVSFNERHLAPVVVSSPYVASEQIEIFARGFSRFFQGDYISAAHLLLPQMEGMVRHILTQAGRPTSMIQSDMTQEDRSLSAIFDTMRNDVFDVFGEAYALEIDTLFLDRRGPALRHVIGHGKLTAADCYGADVVYACWLMWRLICEPLVDIWADNIVPRIEAQLP